MDRAADALAAERPALLARARQGPEAATGHARPRLGRPRARRRATRSATTSASTSGSTRSSATSRRRSSGRVNRGTPGRVARLVAEPRRAPLLLHGQGQHRLPQRDLARAAARLRRGRRVGAGRGRLELPYDIVSSEFLTMEGKQFSTSRGVVIYVGDFLSRYDPDPLRYFLTAAGPETQDTRLHLGGVRAPEQRRARRELGQPRQPHAARAPTRTSAPSPSPASCTEADRAVIARGRGRLRDGRRR